MSDVMPKIGENTQANLNLENIYNVSNQMNASISYIGARNGKMNFVQFISSYPSIEELSFIGFFTVIDVMTIRLLCRDCS